MARQVAAIVQTSPQTVHISVTPSVIHVHGNVMHRITKTAQQTLVNHVASDITVAPAQQVVLHVPPNPRHTAITQATQQPTVANGNATPITIGTAPKTLVSKILLHARWAKPHLARRVRPVHTVRGSLCWFQ